MQVKQLFVAPLHVLQLLVQIWHILLIPVKPDGQIGRHEELYRLVPVTHSIQIVAVEQIRQGFTQGVH